MNAGNATIQMGSASVPGFVKVESTGTLTLIGALNGFGGDGIFVAGGGFPVADPGTVENAGTIIQEEASSTSTIAVGLTNDSSGTVNVESGTLDLTGGATNNGKFETTGGTLDVTTAVSGAGTVSISGGGVAEFGSTFNQNVSFSGPGTLELAQAYTGTISGFDASGTNDTLDLALSAARSGDGFTVTPNYNGTTTTLTITDTTHTGSTTVTLAGNYSNAALAAQNLLWSASSSATGAVTVSEAAPTADTWNNSTASWTTTGDWSTNALPTASQEAVLAGSTTYAVTLTGTQSPFSVLLNNANATLSDQGTLDLTGTLTLTGGAFTLASGGVVAGGTVSDPNSLMKFSGGTLNGVTNAITYEGTMNVGAGSTLSSSAATRLATIAAPI